MYFGILLVMTYTRMHMRRMAAILLLLSFGLFLSSPLLAAASNPYANLPACCRKGGKHHCLTSMMMEREMDQSGTHVSAPPEKCPFFPKAMLPITSPGHLLTIPP